jgi:hypothetical protein
MAVTDPSDPSGVALVPLVEGGEGIDVTGENVKGFVKLQCEFEMEGRCAEGLAEMRRGFEMIVPPQMLEPTGG